MKSETYIVQDITIDKKNDIKLHAESFGNNAKPACILISGAMAPARFWTNSFCEYLSSKGFFVIRYDHRDIGESSGVDWEKAPYDLSTLASDVIKILDAYKIKKAHFVGHSMGGHICQQIGVDFPNYILSLIMISSGPIGASKDTDIPLSKEEKTVLNKTWEIFLKEKDESTIDTIIDGYMLVWAYLNGKYSLDNEMAISYTKDLLLRTKHQIRAGNNHELLMKNVYNALEKNRNILTKIHCPTLVIHGENDPISLPRDGKALAKAINQAKLILIPKMGHMMFNKELESHLAKLLINFFKKRIH